MDLLDNLEQLIDDYGLSEVVSGLADVCIEKAERIEGGEIQSEAPDEFDAQDWRKNGEVLETVIRDGLTR